MRNFGVVSQIRWHRSAKYVICGSSSLLCLDMRELPIRKQYKLNRTLLTYDHHSQFNPMNPILWAFAVCGIKFYFTCQFHFFTTCNTGDDFLLASTFFFHASISSSAPVASSSSSLK